MRHGRTSYAQAMREADHAEFRRLEQAKADAETARTGRETCIDCRGVDGHFSDCNSKRAQDWRAFRTMLYNSTGD